LYQLFIGPIPEGMCVDHIDRNGLNNKLENLRLATTAQNVANRGPWKNKKDKGIRKTKSGKWLVQTTFQGKLVYLGRHVTKKKALEAYNNYAKKKFGNFAVLNEVE
jgi:hypothetical protein